MTDDIKFDRDSNGTYIRVKTATSNIGKKLSLVGYYKSKSFYTFLFMYDNNAYFFVRKTI